MSFCLCGDEDDDDAGDKSDNYDVSRGQSWKCQGETFAALSPTFNVLPRLLNTRILYSIFYMMLFPATVVSQLLQDIFDLDDKYGEKPQCYSWQLHKFLKRTLTEKHRG